jgi:hypothetical protein
VVTKPTHVICYRYNSSRNRFIITRVGIYATERAVERLVKHPQIVEVYVGEISNFKKVSLFKTGMKKYEPEFYVAIKETPKTLRKDKTARQR